MIHTWLNHIFPDRFFVYLYFELHRHGWAFWEMGKINYLSKLVCFTLFFKYKAAKEGVHALLLELKKIKALEKPQLTWKWQFFSKKVTTFNEKRNLLGVKRSSSFFTHIKKTDLFSSLLVILSFKKLSHWEKKSWVTWVFISAQLNNRVRPRFFDQVGHQTT